jgi:hypothetical protein
MQQAIQEEVTYEEEFEIKDMSKAERMLRSEAARSRRKNIKLVREMKVTNEWARIHRAKKKK